MVFIKVAAVLFVVLVGSVLHRPEELGTVRPLWLERR